VSGCVYFFMLSWCVVAPDDLSLIIGEFGGMV
jgi:hypothetical protein